MHSSCITSIAMWEHYIYRTAQQRILFMQVINKEIIGKKHAFIL